MNHTTILRVVMLVCLFSPAIAQAPETTLIPGKTDADDLPLSGAKFCPTSPSNTCFQMPSLRNGDVTYEFGLEPHVRALAVPGNTSWYLFDAMFSGGGSGTLTRYAILRKENAHVVNLLPVVALTNVSESAVWTQPQISPYPLFITADFIWNFDAGETHFGKHLFGIEAWRFDPSKDHYVRAIFYKTARKYDGDDASDSVSVITHERPEIFRRLHTQT
jgi:hypothetical protein